MMHKAWSSIEEVPYCFPRSSIKFQGHTGQNITDFDQNWAFPDYRPVAAFKSLRFALLVILGTNDSHNSGLGSIHELNWNWYSIQFRMNWIGIELNDLELELNWNWKPELIGIDQFNQFIFNSIPHLITLIIFYLPYYGNSSVTSNPM